MDYSKLIGMMANAAAPGGGAGPTPVFIAAGAIAFSSGGSVAPVLPTHQADDILAVSIINVGNVQTDGPGDWSDIASDSGGAYHKWIWRRALGSSETDPTLTAAGGSIFAIAYVIRGCKTTGTPYEDPTVASYASSAHTTPFTSAIDTLGSNRLVSSFFARDNDIAWTVSPPPSLWDLDDDKTTTLGTDARFTAVSKEQASAGSVSAVQIGEWGGGTSSWKSLTLGFIPV